MKGIEKYLNEIIFGKKINGVKLQQPKNFPIREMIEEEYFKWCQEFKVSSMLKKSY
jgi:hypothetical protein